MIEAAAAGDIELVTSPTLLAELREVLSREHLASRLAAQRATVEQTIALYAELAISVSPLATPRVVPGDVNDDHVIAAAVAGAAETIVSGDHDLPVLKTHQPNPPCQRHRSATHHHQPLKQQRPREGGRWSAA